MGNTPSSSSNLVFSCQLAHSSTGDVKTISGFRNVTELYSRIGTAFEFPPEEIMFCTINTARVDMDALLTSYLELTNVIFVHRKGPQKGVELTLDEPSVGVTLTDNGAGVVFIKRIRDGSLASREYTKIHVGDHILEINGSSMLGKKHEDVAKFLKNLPRGVDKKLKLVLVEPLKIV